MAHQIVVDRVVVERHDGEEWIYYSPNQSNASLAVHLPPNTPVARIEEAQLPRKGAEPVFTAFVAKARMQLRTTKQVLRATPSGRLDEELLKSAGFTRGPTGDYSLDLRWVNNTEP